MRQNRSKDKSQSAEQDYSDVLELVEQLAQVLDRADLTEVRIRDNEFEVQVSRYRGTPAGYDRAASPQSSETDGTARTHQGAMESAPSEGDRTSR